MISARNLFGMLLSLILTGQVHADDLVQPSAQITFAEGVVNKITKEPMPEGNWAFDIAIENPNDRDIFCRIPTLTTRLGIWGNQCDRAPYVVYLDLIPRGQNGIIIKAGEIFQAAEAGYDERDSKSKSANKELEFCGMEASGINCSYICPNGKAHGDDWEEQINTNGYKKYKCDSNGETQLVEVYCDSIHKAGDPWTSPIENGRMNYSCSSTGEILSSVSCDNPDKYTATSSACVPRGCAGGTAHDQRGGDTPVPNGVATYICQFGEFKLTTKSIACKAGTRLDGDGCRPFASCGAYPHGSTWIKEGICSSACMKKMTPFTCDDGKEEAKLNDEQTIYCPPRPGKNCVPFDNDF